ncbi:hypothetical protein [Ligilactobacillus salivarius]|uniref:hypothetical protein n=1 Tax=Ligilactobacillus salivarius TaxID=1624 RepID=UPI002966D5B4|nr:hypothetical protein [Ligilactobacillus salivarius]MDW3023084.1 hypothetical protein [Ligilactobacillus salivarius]
MQRKPSPEFAKIIETPNHFYFGPVELSYVVSNSTKVEKFGDKYIVTTSFIADDYTKYDEDEMNN